VGGIVTASAAPGLPRLTILLGAGGVGKTTLSAALGLAHARAGRNTALLSVDPARRLRTALGLADVPEHGARVAVTGAAGALDAALLDPSASLRRWVAEASPQARGELASNPYFVALADRLAGLADAIGCVRAVEWAERDPALAELVLDTAPGLSAVELLARPDKLMAFFDGRLIRWLVRLARLGPARRGGRLLAGLADVSGTRTLRDVGALLSAIETAASDMVVRLERARRWLRCADTALVVVCGVSDDAADVAAALDRAVRDLGFAPSLFVLNRTLAVPPGWTPRVAGDAAAPAHAFARYVRGYLGTQDRVRARLGAGEVRVIDAPDAVLDAPARLDALAALGEPLRAALDPRLDGRLDTRRGARPTLRRRRPSRAA
jgi:anion-transporting  ArsA/GET3 family ATPase